MYNVVNRLKVHDATYLKCRKSNLEAYNVYTSVRTQSDSLFVYRLTAGQDFPDWNSKE